MSWLVLECLKVLYARNVASRVAVIGCWRTAAGAMCVASPSGVLLKALEAMGCGLGEESVASDA